MATGKDRYTTREEVEELLRQTRENADHKHGGEPKAKQIGRASCRERV